MKNRNVQFDIIRTFAIMCVVWCHCSETIYSYTLNGFNLISSKSGMFMMAALTIGRLGVPLFLFLSGALVLSKTFDSDEDIIKFYKKNLVNLILVYEVWVILYNIYTICKTGNMPLVETVVHEMLFLKQVSFSNMWYFPMIIELYICIPFISCFIHKFKCKIINILIFVTLLNSVVLPTMNVYFNLFNVDLSLQSIIQTSFLRSAYALCLLAGYYFNKYEGNRLTDILLIIVGFICTVCVQFFMYNKGIVYNVWYNDLTLLMCAVGIYRLLKSVNIQFKPVIKMTTYVSKASLGVFFVHPIVYKTLGPYIINLNMMMPLKILVLFGLTFVICLFVIYILSKNEVLKKYLFLMK